MVVILGIKACLYFTIIIIIFRKLETEELQKIQLQNQLDRATDRIAR